MRLAALESELTRVVSARFKGAEVTVSRKARRLSVAVASRRAASEVVDALRPLGLRAERMVCPRGAGAWSVQFVFPSEVCNGR